MREVIPRAAIAKLTALTGYEECLILAPGQPTLSISMASFGTFGLIWSFGGRMILWIIRFPHHHITIVSKKSRHFRLAAIQNPKSLHF